MCLMESADQGFKEIPTQYLNDRDSKDFFHFLH